MAASDIDFIPGFDPTAYVVITGAQLLQLVGLAQPYSDKGLLVLTTDVGSNPVVPDATTTAKWANYIWLRVTATQTIPYVWNPNAALDVTFLQWQTIASATIAPGSIQGFMIAAAAITDDKINSVSIGKIVPSPYAAFIQPASAIPAGDLIGSTYANPTVAPGVITGAKIAGQTITQANIAPNGVCQQNICPTNSPTGSVTSPTPVNGQIMQVTAGVSQWVTNQLAALANPTGSNNGQVLAVTGGNVGYVTPNGLGGRVLQTLTASVTSQQSINSAASVPTTYPLGAALTNLTHTFTPLSANSVFIVEFEGWVQYTTVGGSFVGLILAAFFNPTAGSSPIPALATTINGQTYNTAIGKHTTANTVYLATPTLVKFTAVVASIGTAAVTISMAGGIGHSGSGGHLLTNSVTAGDYFVSTFKVTEYL